MNSNNDFSFNWGAVTLLDFLGWKGIWMNDYKKHSHSDSSFNLESLKLLAKLIGEAEEIYRKKCVEYTIKMNDTCQVDNDDGCDFISISDTIAIFTPCDNNEASNYAVLKQHSEICSAILDKSAEEGFALRGAITIGDYACLKNIIVGPGVDECSSWYEQTDWLGVIFAPSAQFVIDEQRNKAEGADNEQTRNGQILWNDSKIVEYHNIPAKNGVRGIRYCVDWGNDTEILNKILKNTISLSRDIAIKYINTNNYLYALRPRKDSQ